MPERPFSPQRTEYRPDIDGLRALAVLSVVGFHAFPRVVWGGFVGVDIFFVVSGFLISSIIYNALRRDAFSYLEFYVRRIRRIFPALLTVLAACLVAGWFLLLPDEYKQLGRQIAAGAGFASNLLLWSQSGYFDTEAAIKPLLHLWSLGIEEQFYLLWPLLLALLYQRTRHLPLIVSGLLVASFACNVAFVHSHPSATFYLPMARFWELLSGALLAYLMIFGRDSAAGAAGGTASAAAAGQGGRRWQEIWAWSGLVLIAAAVLLIDRERAFPGGWALLPTLGTLLIIMAPEAWLNRVVLSNRVLVFIGLISYPLYLWHWVLLSILRMRLYEDGAEAPRSQRIAAVALSFVLAWLTYALIEKPIRFGTRTALKPILLLVLMGVVGLFGLAVDSSDGAAARYPAAIRPLAAYQYDKERAYYSKLLGGHSCFIEATRPDFAHIRTGCIDKPEGGKKLVVLWGDSHAASLYLGLKALQDHGDRFRIAQFTMGACPPLLGWHTEQRQMCQAFNSATIQRIEELGPDIVVLEADWLLYLSVGMSIESTLPALQSTLSQLKDVGVPRIVVFGNLPVWRTAQPKVSVRLWLQTHALPERTRAYFNTGSARADAEVRAAVAGSGAVFVSPIDELCDERGCLLTTDRDKWTPLAWDAAHLTEAGSVYLITRSAAAIFGGRANVLAARCCAESRMVQ
jgi:peptidoglycan/LPS O-acetylase OafA/YrhL